MDPAVTIAVEHVDERNSIFPILGEGALLLADVREAVANTAEFKTSTCEDGDEQLIFYNYRWCTRATFPDLNEARTDRERVLFALRRECRGLVFRVGAAGNVTVAARRFHKFFNINERDDTNERHVDLTLPHRLLVKHDGSLVGPVLLKSGAVRFATKSGFGPIIEMLESRFLSLRENRIYETWSGEWLRRGYSPMFEYVSQRNKIVLEYDNDELILLALRHARTGQYYPYEAMRASALASGIRVTESLDGQRFRDTADMIATLNSKERCEGFVIQFDSGAMYKVKTEWYFARANQKEKQAHRFNTERAVWELLLKQELDDAAPSMDAVLLGQVQGFQVALFAALDQLCVRLTAGCKPHAALSKRDFVALCQRGGHGMEDVPLPLLFSVFDAIQSGDDVPDLVLASAIKMVQDLKKLEVLRGLCDGIRFSERVGDAGGDGGD